MLIKLNGKIRAGLTPITWIIGPVRARRSKDDFPSLPNYRTFFSSKTHSAVEFSDVRGRVEISRPEVGRRGLSGSAFQVRPVSVGFCRALRRCGSDVYDDAIRVQTQ